MGDIFSGIASISASGATVGYTKEKLNLGICAVTFGGVDLGLTHEGEHVKLEVKINTEKYYVNKYGTTAVEEIITGVEASAKCGILLKNDNFNTLLGIATDVTTGLIGTTTVKGALVLAPVDGTDDITFYNASASIEYSAESDTEGKMKITATFTALPDYEGKITNLI